MEKLAQDVRFALRSLVRRPGFALTAIVTPGLGIGSTTAIFSVVNGGAVRGMTAGNAIMRTVEAS